MNNSEKSEYSKEINRRLLAGEPLYFTKEKKFIKLIDGKFNISYDGLLWTPVDPSDGIFFLPTDLEKVYP